MNDRFRFRAWNRETKQYHYGAENTYDYMYGLPSVMKCSFGSLLEDTGEGNRYVVEQCTGLKDASGNLIYEGDIIAVANGSINGNVCISKWEVVWKEKEGRYSVPSWVADKPDFSHYVKVLGNIHENPELLEDK